MHREVDLYELTLMQYVEEHLDAINVQRALSKAAFPEDVMKHLEAAHAHSLDIRLNVRVTPDLADAFQRYNGLQQRIVDITEQFMYQCPGDVQEKMEYYHDAAKKRMQRVKEEMAMAQELYVQEVRAVMGARGGLTR